jgi:hypothetical protein
MGHLALRHRGVERQAPPLHLGLAETRVGITHS